MSEENKGKNYWDRDESPERDERLTKADWDEVKKMSIEDKRERAIRIDED
jgi:hypothetical protein